MKYINYTLEAIGVLFGLAIGFFYIKNKEDKQLLDDNKKTVAGLAVQTQEIATNDKDIKNQAVIQNQLQADIKEVQSETTAETSSNVVDFFNSRKQ